MKRIQAALFGLTLIATSLLTNFAAAQGPKLDAGMQDGIEVQTRGPVHEAFAQPFDQAAAPGPMVPKEPPPPVPEEPPEQRPEADNTQWIPGYWSWDAQKQEFLWVSGVYRVPPQGRTFVPGYWQHTADGWRWVQGFWSDANQPDVPYTPEPPAPLADNPGFQPDVNSTYIPGVWIYRDGRFIWRPGYYAPVRPDRVWISPRYVWTPNGYLFVDGYWDCPFEDRGLLFAPVYFNRPLWLTAGWSYRPSFVVGFDSFFDSAFVGVGGFYFGNYYDPLYARAGFRPWYAGRGRHDPVFAYHGWANHRGNPNWISGVQTTFAGRTAGRVAAPPTTFAAQTATTRVVAPLGQVNSTRLVTTTSTQLQAQRTFAQQTQQLSVNRSKLDATTITRSTTPRTFRATETKATISGSTPIPPASRPIQTPAPRSVTQPSVSPSVTPAPRVTQTPAPRANQTPAPQVNPAPRINQTPAPRAVQQPSVAPRSNPTRVNSAPTVTHSSPVPRAVTTTRVQSMPHVSAPARVQPPRVSTPPARSSPPPRSTPPARSATNHQRR
jgi:hypothetical protein